MSPQKAGEMSWEHRTHDSDGWGGGGQGSEIKGAGAGAPQRVLLERREELWGTVWAALPSNNRVYFYDHFTNETLRPRKRRLCDSWGRGVTVPLLWEVFRSRQGMNQNLHVTLEPGDGLPQGHSPAGCLHWRPYLPSHTFQCLSLDVGPGGDIKLKTKSPANPENFSTKVEEKENNFITE